MKQLACLAILLVAGPAVYAENPPAVTIPASHQHDLRSGTDGREYRLFVAVPPGYDPAGSERYAVTYVLDGNVVFPFAVVAQRMFRLFDEVPDLIVVGIGYPVRFFPETIPSRWRDLTPVRNEKLDAEQSERLGVELRSGGGKEFLRLLREEVIPFVDDHYRTTGDRALWGHSLGGSFALYTLFESPELFQRYGISSPSLPVSGEVVFEREAAYAEQNGSLPARVFITVGSEEHNISPATARLVDTLRERAYDGLTLGSHVFQEESHVSVFPAAFSRGMRFLYPSSAGSPIEPGGN